MHCRLLPLLMLLLLVAPKAKGQTGIFCSDSAVAQVLRGAYSPASYVATTIIGDHASISNGLAASVSPDSLHAFLDVLKGFKTRNSASDTVSATRGIGAARRWAFQKFQQFSAVNDHRLLPAYLTFNYTMCGVLQHSNVLAVLPGADTSDKSIIVIEGHIDSRTVDVCDTSSIAEGMEDNASGTALVLELARVMSRFTFRHTVVFMITTGEEQGLVGAQAFVNYATANGIAIKAVLNNDVIGGIICGQTASAPGCSGAGSIDSTHVRLFSFGGFNSPSKGLSRYVKMQYNERILPTASVPMGINIMTPEDRTGRGGDHIPFRTAGFPAIRFTAANENGDANVTDTAYHDRQHTSRDSLGVDTNGDGILDSFYVDFNFLARNAVINGNAAGMIAIGPKTPDFTLASTTSDLVVNITQHPEYLHYKVGVRTITNDWDSVYEFSGTLTYNLPVPPGNYIVSVASVDTAGVESLFSRELRQSVGVPELGEDLATVELLQNKPNPADEATIIAVQVNSALHYKEAHIVIADMQGKEVARMPVALSEGINEVIYNHGYHHASGTYLYTLVIDGKPLRTRKMTFTN